MRRVIMLVLFVACAVITNGSAHGITVDEAVSTAVRNNTELQSLRYEGDVARAQLEEGCSFRFRREGAYCSIRLRALASSKGRTR